MKSLFQKDVFSHPAVLGSIAAVVVIAIGSVAYYVISTRSPAAGVMTAQTGSITQTVLGNGTVEPAQNPNLAFVSGGRVASVRVSVGDKVYQGETLAALDTATLAAQRAAAQASVKAAQAKLDEMQAGPRQTDVSAGQTAVSQAQQTLSNAYANIPATLTDAYNKAYNGVRQNTDSLFSQPTSQQPVVAFQTTDSQSAVTASSQRATLNAQLEQWQSKIQALSSGMGGDSTDAVLSFSLDELTTVRSYTATLLQALANAVPSGNFDAAAITAAQTSVGALNTTASALILSLQGAQQSIASDKLGVQSAQDALNKILAGSQQQDIEAQQAQVEAAQAQVDSINAQIANDVVIAPFSGTVASVNVKSGESVAPNTVAVSLTPASALQVELYVSEVDAAKLSVGNRADVTLDAYGNGRTFGATVVSIDRAPTMQNGVPSYKVVLQFDANDPSIATGMGANATITAAQKSGVVVIPRRAVLQSASGTFILLPGENGPVQRQVQIGVENDTEAEVISGLSADEQYLVNSK